VRLLAPLLAAALAPLAACGPVRSTSALLDAEAQLDAARTAGARTAAPYEYTAAEVYLRAAREADGRARYDEGTRLAARATELGRAAAAKANAGAAGGKRP
jgi:hypothetical protein